MTYELLEDFDLGLETVPVLYLGAGDQLDGPALAVLAMDASADFAISAFSELLKVTKRGKVINV